MTNIDAGAVTAQTIYTGGAVDISEKKWKAEGLTIDVSEIVNSYREYVASKEETITITSIGEIQQHKVNIINGPVTISTEIAQSPFVLIVNGDVTINKLEFNPDNNPQAILATGNITFADTVQEANGLFIAQEVVNLGSSVTQGIKIKGNIIANSLVNKRRWTDNPLKPGFFMVFDPSHYMELIDLLSKTTYDWKQLQ